MTVRGASGGAPSGLHVPRRRPAAATSSFTYDQRAPHPPLQVHAASHAWRAPTRACAHGPVRPGARVSAPRGSSAPPPEPSPAVAGRPLRVSKGGGRSRRRRPGDMERKGLPAAAGPISPRRQPDEGPASPANLNNEPRAPGWSANSLHRHAKWDNRPWRSRPGNRVIPSGMPRKVRAPQGTVPGNAWAARADGKCNRKIPPNGPPGCVARVKWCGKSAPRAW